jgi:glycerophosphoryl diester phosphodiesterase
MSPAHERRLYGHRGARALMPENTIPSFARALQDGANALETDVHLTADGEVVVIHDPDGKRVAGIDRPIAACTLAEVRGWNASIPTLHELLDAFPKIRINVDIKPDSAKALEPVLKVIRSHRAESRVTVASFHHAVMHAAAQSDYRGELSLSQRAVLRCVVLPVRLLQRYRLPGHAIQIPTRVGRFQLDTPAFIERCHSLGLRVDYWVVNEAAEAKRLLDAGADGIITDDPARIAPAMWGGKPETS